MAGEPRVFGGEHDAAGLAPDTPHDQRHHEGGQQRGDPRAAAQEHPIDRAEGSGRMLPHHGGEAARRPTGRLDAHDLVGEREQQLTSLRVREQPSEPVLPPTLGASGVGQAVGEHPPRERDGPLDQCRVGGHVPIEARAPTVTSLADDPALHGGIDR